MISLGQDSISDSVSSIVAENRRLKTLQTIAGSAVNVAYYVSGYTELTTPSGTGTTSVTGTITLTLVDPGTNATPTRIPLMSTVVLCCGSNVSQPWYNSLMPDYPTTGGGFSYNQRSLTKSTMTIDFVFWAPAETTRYLAVVSVGGADISAINVTTD